MNFKKCYPLVCLLLATTILFSCTSCGVKVKAQSLSDEYSRKASETLEINKEFIKSINKFSFDLFSKVIENKNTLISPMSAAICLSMTANGADSNTKLQIEKAFGMDIETLNKYFNSYISSIYTAKDCKVKLADSIWISNDIKAEISQDFLQSNADWYGANVFSAPFDKSTVDDINNWCKDKTDGMINEIIKKIPKDAIMFLINALMFDSEWAEKYEKKDIIDGLFNNYDKSTSSVKMLSSEESVFIDGDNEKGFIKNYSGDRYSFVSLLPSENTDIFDYVKSLNNEKFSLLLNSIKDLSVKVLMPEFEYSTDINLIKVLKSMGVSDMFDENADFSKMLNSNKKDLFCSVFHQKAFIKVDRNGTKAAAITIGGMNKSSNAMELIELNRPFVYFILDNKYNVPLFLGIITDLKV